MARPLGAPGKEATVYVGSKDDAFVVAKMIEDGLRDVLLPPTGDALVSDIEFTELVMGRFDVMRWDPDRLGYFRAHGRNEQGYIRGRSVAERFDYDYSDAEVGELAVCLRAVESQVKELRVVANNNRSDYAPKLAERLQALLRKKEGLAARLHKPRPGELF